MILMRSNLIAVILLLSSSLLLPLAFGSDGDQNLADPEDDVYYTEYVTETVTGYQHIDIT